MFVNLNNVGELLNWGNRPTLLERNFRYNRLLLYQLSQRKRRKRLIIIQRYKKVVMGTLFKHINT